MILKLLTQDNNNGLAWRILDNIKQIDSKGIDDSKIPFKKSLDYININNTSPNEKMVEIRIIYENGDISTIYTDSIAYILNNTGKTIERFSGKSK